MHCRGSLETEEKRIPGLVWEWLAENGYPHNSPFIDFGYFVLLNIQNKEKRYVKVNKFFLLLFLSVNRLFLPILFHVLLNQTNHDQEPLSALALHCLCTSGPTPCSCKPFLNKTWNFSLLHHWTVYTRQGPVPGHVFLN